MIGSNFDISKFYSASREHCTIMHMHANYFSYNRTDRQSVCCKNFARKHRELEK